MATRVYEYKNCTTCKRALRFLETKKVVFETLPIVDQPPTKAELRKMLATLKASGGTLKSLFNTSGELYREMKISEKIKNGLSEEEALQLLSQHGKLVKRPFVVGPKGQMTVGFNEDLWKTLF